MHRSLLILTIVILLAACAPQVDRCTADPNLSDCRANQAVAQSTIAAANADTDARVRQAQMQATKDAVSLHAQATQSAIIISSTAVAVSAQATRTSMEMDALRISLAMTATLQSAQARIVGTQTALEGETKLRAATVEADTAALGQIALFFSAMAILLALALYVVVYSRRVASSLAAGVETRASLIRYGRNNERIAYRVQRADGTLEFVPIDQILGHSDRYLDSLNVPPMAKLAALVEADKRTKGVLISQAGGVMPMLSVGSDDAPALSPPPPGQPADSLLMVPTFAQMLRLWRPTADRMLFGYSDAGPIYGRIDQLLSVEIIGRQGQGKTTLLRLIYAQCLMIGVQIVVWDLHEDIVDDLPGAQTYTSAESIEQSAVALQAELDRRIAEHDKGGAPVMALVDEINQLVNVVPIVAQVIGRIVNEGRKYKMFCIVSAKGIPATLFGGSTVRDAFSSRFAFNTTARQAAMIGFDKDRVGDVRDLTPGRALFEGPVPAQVITVPNTTADDVKNVLATSHPLTSSFFATSATSGEVAPHFQPVEAEVGEEVGTEVTAEVGTEVTAEVGSERHTQVRDLLRAQTPVNQIVKQVWGVGPGGRAYQDATAELRQIMSELV